MKFKIGTETLKIQQIPNFDEIPTNTQHPQLPGYVLVDIPSIGPGNICINFYHPSTGAGNGHVDIIVEYTPDEIRFRQYSQSEKFSPAYLDDALKHLWPTGTWNFLEIVLCLENHMFKEFGFTPLLRRTIIELLSKK